MVRLAAALVCLALAGCGEDDPPLDATCTASPEAIVRALDGAPGEVALASGTRLSQCVSRARDRRRAAVGRRRAHRRLRAAGPARGATATGAPRCSSATSPARCAAAQREPAACTPSSSGASSRVGRVPGRRRAAGGAGAGARPAGGRGARVKLRLHHHHDGARVAYREAGTGPGLVLLHSALLTHREWEPVVEHLSDRFRLVLPDLPLHGDSEDRPRHPYTLDWLAEVLAAFCRETAGPRPLVGGHGLGAEVLLRGDRARAAGADQARAGAQPPAPADAARARRPRALAGRGARGARPRASTACSRTARGWRSGPSYGMRLSAPRGARRARPRAPRLRRRRRQRQPRALVGALRPR